MLVELLLSHCVLPVESVEQTATFIMYIFRLENSRDDMCVRGEILEREVGDLQHRNEELTSLAQEAQTLKDEMDILRWDQCWCFHKITPDQVWLVVEAKAVHNIIPVLYY